MAIPEAQLNTWSAVGASQQSKNTYAALKGVLDHPNSPYYPRSFESFLQGSYGNDTNVVGRDSDVDIVLRFDSAFQFDLEQMPDDHKARFQNEYPSATHSYTDFKVQVISWLKANYPGEVEVGTKAIRIEGSGNRRDTDVLPCMAFRRYYRFDGMNNENFVEGICFWDANGNRIINYPKQHMANCTTKHQSTNSYFKAMVRIIKNMRNRMVEHGMLEEGLAPSYYLEGLMYNVPNNLYGTSYAQTFINAVNWLVRTDRSQLVCANEQYYLLRPNSPVCWEEGKCKTFLDAVIDHWNDW